MKVKELGHLVLYVRDASESARFYRDVLGWRQVLPGGRRARRRGGRLLERPHASRAAPHRSGSRTRPRCPKGGVWGCTTSVSRSATPMTSSGRRSPASGRRRRIVGSSDHTVTHSVYLLDPDGNEIEIYIDVAGVDWKSDGNLVASPDPAVVDLTSAVLPRRLFGRGRERDVLTDSSSSRSC